MGNCPSGFQASPKGAFSCVHECPRQKGFELLTVAGAAACVYRDRPEVYFPLREVMGLDKNNAVATVAEIRNPQQKAQFQAAIEDYGKESALALAKVEKDVQLADAFRALQVAENVRDQSPQAYQDARIRYYTLLNGDGWVEEEKTRITNAEAVPKISQFLAQYQDLNSRIQQQQKTKDVVNGVKDKLISMKDDFKMTTDVFSKQIADLKNQIEIEKKSNEIKTESAVGWMGFLVNLLLVITALAAAIVLIRKLMQKQSPSPAYTSYPGLS